MLKSTELIRLSIGIENEVDSSGDLRPVPGKDSALFSISHHQTGYSAFFRYDLPLDIRRQIEALDPEVALKDHDKVAFYSHEVGNTASEALAHSLGVVQYAVVTTYESKATAG